MRIILYIKGDVPCWHIPLGHLQRIAMQCLLYNKLLAALDVDTFLRLA